jgi:tol-pal system protein YbgF
VPETDPLIEVRADGSVKFCLTVSGRLTIFLAMSIRAPVLVLAWFALVGCGSPMTTLRKDNQRLSGELAELRTDRRVLDRKLHDLEHQLALARDGKAADPSVPELPVEVVAPPPVTSSAPSAPENGRVVGIADDGGEIVYEGDAALGKTASIDDDATSRRSSRVARVPAVGDDALPTTSDHLEVTHHVPLAARPPRVHMRTDRDSPSPGDPATEYRAAVELVRTGKYETGIAALRAFLAHYPRHEYADHAQYWLGEAFYAEKNFAQALAEFRATIEAYPRGNKVPDAMLKLGYCYQAMGDSEKARATLAQVVATYPRSEPAQLAAKRLETP